MKSGVCLVFIFCHLILFGCVSESTRKNPEKPTPTYTATPIPPDAVETAINSANFEEVIQFISGDNGSVFAITQELEQDHQKFVSSKLKARLLDAAGSVFSTEPLISGSRISAIQPISAQNFRAILESSEMDRTGMIHTNVQPYDITLGNKNQFVISERSPLSIEFSLRTYVEKKDRLLEGSESEAQLYRKSLIEAFQDYYLRPSPNAGPVFLRSQNEDFAFINHQVESALVSLGSGKLDTIKPLDLRLDDSATVIACRSEDSKMFFAANGQIRQLRPIVRLLGIAENSLTHQSGKANGGTLVFERTAAGDLVPVRFVPHLDIETADVAACYSIGDTVYLTGALTLPKNPDSRVWAGVVSRTGIDVKYAKFSKNAAARSLYVNGQNRSLVIGGKFNFDQAATGSVSDCSGFVLILDSELNELQRFNFTGDRSTSVTTVWMPANSEKIYVGGYTNGPSTHSKNRSAKSFVSIINNTKK